MADIPVRLNTGSVGYKGAVNLVNYGTGYISGQGSTLSFHDQSGWNGYDAIVPIGQTWGRTLTIPAGFAVIKTDLYVKKTVTPQQVVFECRNNPGANSTSIYLNTITGALVATNTPNFNSATPLTKRKVTDVGSYWLLHIEAIFNGTNDATQENLIFLTITGDGWRDGDTTFVASTEDVHFGDASLEIDAPAYRMNMVNLANVFRITETLINVINLNFPLETGWYDVTCQMLVGDVQDTIPDIQFFHEGVSYGFESPYHIGENQTSTTVNLQRTFRVYLVNGRQTLLVGRWIANSDGQTIFGGSNQTYIDYRPVIK